MTDLTDEAKAVVETLRDQAAFWRSMAEQERLAASRMFVTAAEHDEAADKIEAGGDPNTVVRESLEKAMREHHTPNARQH
jgi:hypothetical protein